MPLGFYAFFLSFTTLSRAFLEPLFLPKNSMNLDYSYNLTQIIKQLNE